MKRWMIVVGKVTDVKSGWTEPKTIPSTFVSVSIEEGVKGYLTSSEITIEVPGGSDGKVLSIVLGMPEFHKGERVLLFLIRDLHSDKYYLVHGGYGKYRVGPDNEMADLSKTLPEFLSEIRQYISVLSSYKLNKCNWLRSSASDS